MSNDKKRAEKSETNKCADCSEDDEDLLEFIEQLEVIDIHTHVWPKFLAPKVKKLFTSYGQPILTDLTIEGLRRQMHENGVSKAVLLSVATKPSQVETINDELRPYIGNPVFTPFAAVHPDCDDPVGVIRRASEDGFKGVKLHPVEQHFMPQEKRMFPIYDAIIEEGMVLLFHSGPSANSKDVNDRSLSYAFDGFFDHYDYDKVIVAHMAGLMGVQEVPEDFVFDRPGYVDLAYTTGITPDDVWLDMFHRFGTERVMYGSDSPFRSQRYDIEHIAGIGLTKQELRMIFHDNAAKLLGM
ncbi:MAG: amidohydrolase family protein [Coriobacteriales bacterium]|jgi:predicted TIM-barrel fold metal-dependent hydrolase